MEQALKLFYLSALIFLVITLVFNFLYKNFPKIPGDIYIDRPGIRLYIPFVSVVVLTILAYIFFGKYL